MPSISLDQENPSYSDVVTFTVETGELPPKSLPLVRLLGYQGDAMVYQYSGVADTVSFYLGAPSIDFHQPTEFVADLYYYTYKGKRQTGVVYLASTEFTVTWDA